MAARFKAKTLNPSLLKGLLELVIIVMNDDDGRTPVCRLGEKNWHE